MISEKHARFLSFKDGELKEARCLTSEVGLQLIACKLERGKPKRYRC